MRPVRRRPDWRRWTLHDWIRAVRARVNATWRTRVLLILAILVAGAIALFQVRERESRPRERPERAEPRGDVIEIELRD